MQKSCLPLFNPKKQTAWPRTPVLVQEVDEYVSRVLKMNRIVFKYFKISNYFIFRANS